MIEPDKAIDTLVGHTAYCILDTELSLDVLKAHLLTMRIDIVPDSGSLDFFCSSASVVIDTVRTSFREESPFLWLVVQISRVFV